MAPASRHRPKGSSGNAPSPEDDAFFASVPGPSPAEAEHEAPPAWPPFHRLVLSATLLLSVAWLVSPLADELRYHFSATELVDIGDASSIQAENVPPLGAYVRVEGVLGNKAATLSGVVRPASLRPGPVQVRQLLGSALFVEFDQESLHERYAAFTRVRVEGRIASLGPEGELAQVRSYFEQRLGLKVPREARVIIVDERPGALWRYPVAFAIAGLLALSSLSPWALTWWRRRR